MVECWTGGEEVASSIPSLGSVVFSLDRNICITLVSVDSAKSEDQAMGRSNIIVRMIELIKLRWGVGLVNDTTGPLGR